MTAFAPWEGLTAMDDRRVARIFMASSRVLKEERAAFDGVVDAVSRVPHINRTFRLQPIRWETHAYGAAATEINRSIRESVDFTDSECVVVACDDRIGPGTRDEYDEALRLLRQHGRPQVFVYIKDRVDTVPEVEAFREEALTQGVVVKGYPSTNLWLEMLKRDLTQHFAKRHTGEGEEPVRLRRQFLASAWISASSALGIIGLCRLVRPPEGLSQPIALAILASPLILVGLSAWVQWNYDRLLAALREAWRSPQWVDEASYRPFRGLVPRFALPRPMSLSIPRIGIVGVIGLALAFFSGVVGIYNCVFEQMLRWEYAASWKTVAEARVEPLRTEAGVAIPCTSDGGARPDDTLCYVDRGRSRFDFTIRDPRVANALAAESRNEARAVLYVHAQGRFAEPEQPSFRNSLGPEVRLPLWPVLGSTALLWALALGLSSLWKLVRFRRDLTRL